MRDIVFVIVAIIICILVLGGLLKLISKRPLKQIIDDIISFLIPW